MDILTPQDYALFAAIGFVAQLVDGTLGMAYGVISSSFLLSFGLPPAIASACVHTAEVFISGASGLAHLKFGNVDRALFRSLVVTGVAGAILGAYVLTSFPGHAIRPFVSLYLIAMGLVILVGSWRGSRPAIGRGAPAVTAAAGGFLDSVGGGGWGPIVTSSLMAGNTEPRLAVGSANLAELFVTIAAAATFAARTPEYPWKIIWAIVAGGVLAAPLAAWLTGRLAPRVIATGAGLIVIVTSLVNLLR